MLRAAAVLAGVIPCLAVGAGAWLLYWRHLEHGLDWMVFYTAARAAIDGDPGMLLDTGRFMAALTGRFAGWLTDAPLVAHPWVYPPHFLALFLPFGVLPPQLSYAAFVALTFAGLMAVLWQLCRPGWLCAASVILSPAAAYAVTEGQNAFLAAALLIGGCVLMHTRPLRAGILFGLLSFKPQLCLMVPVALIAAAQWRVCLSAAATGIAAFLVSLLMFGPELWFGWLAMMTDHSDFFDQWSTVGRLNGMSVYACAVVAGASPAVARLAQVSAVLIAALSVLRAFHRDMPADMRLAVLLTATFLAAPHVANYDAVLLAVAATLVFRRAYMGDLPICHMPLAAMLWASPLLGPPSVIRVGIYVPLLACIFLTALLVPNTAVLTRPRRTLRPGQA
jgi:alpha-1,2-mannosyltransferase